MSDLIPSIFNTVSNIRIGIYVTLVLLFLTLGNVIEISYFQILIPVCINLSYLLIIRFIDRVRKVLS